MERVVYWLNYSHCLIRSRCISGGTGAGWDKIRKWQSSLFWAGFVRQVRQVIQLRQIRQVGKLRQVWQVRSGSDSQVCSELDLSDN